MSLTSYLVLTLVLIGAELVYLRLARQFGIVDKPNERSSHTSLVIVRGGGIVFWIALLMVFFYTDFAFPYFFLGLTLVSAISFLDDLQSLPNRYRLGIQVLAVCLLLYQTNIPDGLWMIGLVVVVSVGILNAYNFMDGINGITAFYSLVTVATLWYGQVQQTNGSPVNDPFLPVSFMALLVFSYFNARREAICFAGDVGSVSMAFIILYALLRYINANQTYLPILFLTVYGIDSVLTIIHRLYLRQNIFQPHRLHLFQLLVHTLQWPHLRVATLYALIQLVINGIVLVAMGWSTAEQLTLAGVILGLMTSVYGAVKSRLMTLENKKRVGLSKPTPQ